MDIVLFSVGNPGPMNRHSTGHYVLKKLADAFGAKQMAKKGKYSATQFGNVHFVKSNAYMNESGAPLKAYLRTERLAQCVVVVVYDDFELAMPKARLQRFKKNESHNGVKSVAREVEGVEAYKLGVGIGPKPQAASKDTMAAWVLADFKPEEKAKLETAMQYVFKLVDALVSADGDVGDCNKLNARVTKAMAAADEANGV